VAMLSTLFVIKKTESEWFIQLRWLAAGMGLLVVGLCLIFYPSLAYLIPLIAVLLTLMVLNVIYSWIQGRLKFSTAYASEKHKMINRLLRVQIAGDLLILFFLLLFSGGIQNPLVFLFLLHIVIASILFPKHESLIYALICSFFPWALFLLAWLGWNPSRLSFLDQRFSLMDDACRLIAFLVVAGGIWLIVSRIAEQLRSAQKQVKTSEDTLVKTQMDLTVVESHRNKLLNNLSKELGRPIKVIADHFDELEKDVRNGDIAKSWGILHSLRNELAGLRDIAVDLEWFSKPHWPQGIYEKERIDLMALAAKEILRQEMAATEKNIRIKLEGPKRLLLDADRRAVQQILAQLLNNAVKYSAAGKGDVVLKVEKQVPFAFFSVEDHGMGIPEDEKNTLFQEFSRSSNAENSEMSGSGLGLYIVKQAVDWHRGMIKVESVLGEGTTVKVWLPQEQNIE
jgi:signal transduction histidine kinase